jgi:O-antigen/teichoic acid export membrane protein
MTIDEGDLTLLFSSTTLVLAGTVVGSVSKLIERVIVARWLSIEAFGEINLALAVLHFGVTLSLVGFNQGVPRFVSRYEADSAVRGVWIGGLGIATAVSVGIAAGVWLFDIRGVVALFFDGEGSVQLVRLFVLALPFVVGTMIAVGTIRGLENTRYKTLTQDLFYPFARIVLLVGLLSLGFGLFAAAVAYVVAAVLTFVVAHIMLHRLCSLVGPVETNVRELVVFSAPLIVATILSRLLTWTDTLMLGYFRSSAAVGLYSAAYPLANSLVLLFGAFGFMYLPMISRFDAADERGEINRLFQLTTKWIVVGTFPAFLALAVFPADVLGIVFGAEYTPAALVLTILTVGFFSHAATGRNRETISAIGFTKYVFLSNVVAFVANVVLNVLLIPRYGIVGAAVASASSYLFLNAFVNVVLRWRFGLSSFSGPVLRTFAGLGLLVVPPTVVLSQWVSLSLYTLPVILVVGGLATVAVVGVCGGLQSEDRIVVEQVESWLGRRLPIVHRFLPNPSTVEE